MCWRFVVPGGEDEWVEDVVHDWQREIAEKEAKKDGK